MKNLLFATDFSEAAEHALAYAVALTRDLHATLDLLHIFHLSPSETSHFTAPHETKQVLEQHEKEAMEKLRLSATAAGMPVVEESRLHAEFGQFVAHGIRTFAVRKPYDLLIVASKGKGRAKEVLFGSVATKLLTESTCPLLVIPPKVHYQGIRAIAYATNFAPSDHEMVANIGELSRQLGGIPTHYLHVSEQHSREQNQTGHRNIHLQRDVAPFDRFSWIEHETVLQGINSYVLAEQIDLLVLFIPDRGFWNKLFHRSVSRKVVSGVSVPLLVFFA